jgi:hypothetical protein
MYLLIHSPQKYTVFRQAFYLVEVVVIHKIGIYASNGYTTIVAGRRSDDLL